MSLKQDLRTNFPAALLLYAAVLVYQGYQYGQSDQTQILPCLWAQDHPGAYAQDHYVQHYLSSGTNERTIFHFLLRHLGYNQPWLVWCWHALSSITLILAMTSIASLFIKNKVWQWLSIAIILMPAYHTATGSNELYYNLFVPSLAAKALAAWAIYYWLKEKYAAWSILLVCAGYLQPLVGLQLFLLTSVVIVFEKWRLKKVRDIPWKFILLYCAATLPWLYLLARNNGGSSDPVTFMKIIEFRLSHHFLASSFGVIHLVLGLLFATISIWYYKGRLRWFFIAAIAGCVVYEIGVEWMSWPIALYTQWWKTTIWIEAFAIIALLAMIEKTGFFNKLITKLNAVILLFIFGLACLYRLSGLFGDKPVYMLPWTNYKTDEAEISEMAHQLTPENSIFIIPPQLTAFRWYSKRDTYIDHKAMLHTEIFLKDWYRRIVDVYQYGFEEKNEGYDFLETANKALTQPSPDSINKWRSLGITHIISPDTTIVSLELMEKNMSYCIYKIQ